MENLLINSSTNTPDINFSANEGKFHISGRSFPENVFDFYSQVINYIETYVKQPCAETEIVFDLSYFNTASYKIIVKLLLAFTDIHKVKSIVKVKWLCDKNDITIIEKGEELKTYIKLDFEISYK